MPNVIKTRKPVLFATAVAAVATCVAAYGYLRRKLYAPLATVPHVNLHKYSGLWYEVARLPIRYEKGCQHVTAKYKLRPDGKVSVLNTCHQEGIDGPVETAKGVARALDSTNAKLKVSFFWPFEGDYWILDLDESDYRYALVGTPSRENLWILSRTPHLERTLRDMLVGKAHELGFPIEKLLFTPQPIADKP
ncbi:lipocalin family protein [Hymenobacter norwichensis]|uniref:lipocalin family protein n=1 Tax=Hymenobacter norwichensis TaxID=223903 RepID=UPI0003B527FA|nr:lipocalin family protein [Hymenobacter norwichensis]